MLEEAPSSIWVSVVGDSIASAAWSSSMTVKTKRISESQTSSGGDCPPELNCDDTLTMSVALDTRGVATKSLIALMLTSKRKPEAAGVT